MLVPYMLNDECSNTACSKETEHFDLPWRCVFIVNIKNQKLKFLKMWLLPFIKSKFKLFLVYDF